MAQSFSSLTGATAEQIKKGVPTDEAEGKKYGPMHGQGDVISYKTAVVAGRWRSAKIEVQSLRPLMTIEPDHPPHGAP